MSVVGQILRAELLKVRTTRVVLGLLAGMTGLVLLLVCLTIGGTDAKELRGQEGLRQVLSVAGSIAYLFTLSLGIIGMAGEYRHGTLGHSMLAAPRRWEIVVAKLIAYFIAGVAFTAVALALTYIIALLWMPSKDAGFSLTDPIPLKIAWGSLLGGGLFGAIGVGLGALMKDQVAALLVGVGWTLVVDGIVGGVLPEVGRFFPGGALGALIREPTDEILPIGLGALVLLGYTVAFAVLGTLAARRRDLT